MPLADTLSLQFDTSESRKRKGAPRLGDYSSIPIRCTHFRPTSRECRANAAAHCGNAPPQPANASCSGPIAIPCGAPRCPVDPSRAARTCVAGALQTRSYGSSSSERPRPQGTHGSCCRAATRRSALARPQPEIPRDSIMCIPRKLARRAAGQTERKASAASWEALRAPATTHAERAAPASWPASTACAGRLVTAPRALCAPANTARAALALPTESARAEPLLRAASAPLARRPPPAPALEGLKRSPRRAPTRAQRVRLPLPRRVLAPRMHVRWATRAAPCRRGGELCPVTAGTLPAGTRGRGGPQGHVPEGVPDEPTRWRRHCAGWTSRTRPRSACD